MNKRGDFFAMVRFRRFAPLALLAMIGPFGFAADKPAAPAVEPKTHTVFVGLDLSVKLEGQSRRIVGISKSAAEIEVGARLRRVPAEGLTGFVLQRVPKVSSEHVELAEIKVDPAFRTGGVIDRAWAEAKQAQWLGETILDVAEGRADLRDQSPKVQEALRTIADGGGGGKLEMRELGKRSVELGELDRNELEDEAQRRNLHDALDVSFLVSAPQPVSDCYAALVCTIRGGGAGPQAVNVVFFCELGEVGSEPRRMKTQFGGVPTGFQLLRAEFHVYSRARELASNVAPNSMLLTERQANQFMVLQYASAHKGQTLPARVASTPASGESLKNISGREKGALLQLAIDATGTVTSVTPDRSSQALQEYVSSLRFYPALENGKAVASTLSVTWGELWPSPNASIH
jgi:hypothetical protein